MCGIAGIVGPGAEHRLGLLQRMNTIQRHRGPDAEGTFTDPGVALGHVRLAILDLSDAGRQPMTSPDGRYVISHNGEVYNYLELREQLAGTGPFVTDTDTEVILRAYAAWGPACLERFIGMFGFAIWDRKTRVLFCARDRFGIKPFYYAEHDGFLVFASEIKAVLQSGLPRRACLPVVRDYVALGHYEHAPETFFQQLYRLMPGHYLQVRPGSRPVIRQYYDLAARVQEDPTIGEADAAARLRELLEDAVRLRLRADVKVGVNLSGGLDSSIMLALVDQLAAEPEQIEAFSCDYAGHRESERPWVELMARATRRRVNFSIMDPDAFWRSLDAAVWHEEEPFGGLATAAWTGLYHNARERQVTVLLGGTGLDDHLGGYRANHMTYLAGCRQRGEDALFERELKAYGTAWGLDRIRALKEVERGASGTIGTAALDGSNPVRPECLIPELARAPGLSREFARPFSSPLKNQMYQGLAYTKIPRALRFKDRMSMAYSKELRVPFLDHRLVELSFGLPDSLLVQRGFTKYILRQAVDGLVPDSVRWTHKRSVPVPQREWLAGPLSGRVTDLVESRAFTSRGVFDPQHVKTCYAAYRAGNQANSFFIWQWINLELWFRTFIDPPQLPSASPAHRPVPTEWLDPTRERRVAATAKGAR